MANTKELALTVEDGILVDAGGGDKSNLTLDDLRAAYGETLQHVCTVVYDTASSCYIVIAGRLTRIC